MLPRSRPHTARKIVFCAGRKRRDGKGNPGKLFFQKVYELYNQRETGTMTICSAT